MKWLSRSLIAFRPVLTLMNTPFSELRSFGTLITEIEHLRGQARWDFFRKASLRPV